MRGWFLTPRTKLLILICYCSFFLCADQNALAPNLEQIAEEFGFDSQQKDQKLGAELALGFFVVGAPAALLVGWMTDVVNRIYLAVAVFTISGSACLATYFTTNYQGLYFARVVTGIGIGGCQPLVYSLLADMYPANQRTLVNTLVGIAAAMGVAGGQLLSGLVGTADRGGWRLPFLLISIPGLLGSILLLVLGQEPRRGGGEEEFLRVSRASSSSSVNDNKLQSTDMVSTSQQQLAADGAVVAYEEKLTLAKVFGLFTTPTVLLVFLQGFPGCLPWGFVGVFLNDYLSSDRGMSVHYATVVLTCFNVGSIAGGVGGGLLGQRLFNASPRWQVLLMSGSTLIAILPLLYLINAPATTSSAFTVFCFVAIFGGFIASFNGPNVRAVLQGCISPELRGTAFAIFTVCDDLGRAGGPALSVQLIGLLGRRNAFNADLVGWAICGALLFLATFTYETDLTVVQERVRGALRQRVANELEGEEGDTDLAGEGDGGESGSGGGAVWRRQRQRSASLEKGLLTN